LASTDTSFAVNTPEPFSFTNTYQGLPRGERYEHWVEEICRGVCKMNIGPSPGLDIVDVRTQITNLASVTLATAVGLSADIGRSQEIARDGSDDFTLICHVQDTLPFHSQRETEVIGPSTMLLGELTDASGATLGNCRKFSTLVIDRKTLLKSSPKVESLLFKPLRVAEELRVMIERYAALAVDAAPHAGPHGRILMGQHLVDLVTLALGSRPDDREFARQRGQAQARLALMKADIAVELADGDLGIEALARRYGLSARQAQRLFEQDGITFTEFVLEHRLLLARKMLADPANTWRKINDIAYSAGFADLSYFNRSFRRRFGRTPSDFRRS
jgi:AraC-like DNA-binding protein